MTNNKIGNYSNYHCHGKKNVKIGLYIATDSQSYQPKQVRYIGEMETGIIPVPVCTQMQFLLVKSWGRFNIIGSPKLQGSCSSRAFSMCSSE